MGQVRTSLTVSSPSLILLFDPYTTGKYDLISAAIRRDLHWLPIQYRVHFKLNNITSNCLADRAPEYLIELCHSVNDIYILSISDLTTTNVNFLERDQKTHYMQQSMLHY